MAQSWRKGSDRGEPRPARPLDPSALDRLALRYVERFATTRAKLASYLRRKVRERGWSDDSAPDVDVIVERMAALRYVDDASFATARASSLTRRGYGPRRVAASLQAAGVDDADADEARQVADDGAWQAALAFARRKKIGPFAAEEPDRAGREKAFAALLRAGHDVATARRIVQCAPGSVPQSD